MVLVHKKRDKNCMASKLPIRQAVKDDKQFQIKSINKPLPPTPLETVVKITDLDQSDEDTTIIGNSRDRIYIRNDDNDNNNGDNDDVPTKQLPQSSKSKIHSHHRQRYGNELLMNSTSKFSSGQKSRCRSSSCGVGRRSKSTGVERNVVMMNKDGKKSVDINYYKFMIQTKDEHIEKLIDKITNLQLFNGQFSQENERLNKDNIQLANTITILNQKLNEVQNSECQICKNLLNERYSLIDVNKNLNEDVNMLKTLVYRLNVQLERDQDKLREISTELHQKNSTEQQKFDIQLGTIIPLNDENTNRIHDWGDVNSHTLAPLLNAYDEMIKEKNHLLEQHGIELNRFTGNLKKIIAENTELNEKIDQLQKANDEWKNEKIRMEAHLNVYHMKAEVQTKRADIAKEKLQEILRCYEQKIQSQSLDLERLQDAYTRTKSEIIAMKNLQQQNQPSGQFAENLKECQKLFEELKFEYSNEKKNLSNDIDELKKLKLDLEQKLSVVENENKILKNLQNAQREEYEELKRKNSDLKEIIQKLKESKDRIKLKYHNILEWCKKLEDGQQKVRNTWNDIKELEALVKHKDAQIKGLNARYLIEIEKLENKLQQKDQTIRKILKDKVDNIEK